MDAVGQKYFLAFFIECAEISIFLYFHPYFLLFAKTNKKKEKKKISAKN